MKNLSPPIAIPIHSTFGNTATLAQSVCDGIQTGGLAAQILPIQPQQLGAQGWHDEAVMNTLIAAPAIIFGAPTYMGGVSGLYKMFLDSTGLLWQDMRFKDKLAGGFTTSSRSSGDKSSSLAYLITYAMQMRMLWIGTAEPDDLLTGKQAGIDRFGFYGGAVGQGSMAPDWAMPQGDLATAHAYGLRIAQAVKRWGV
jgi:NAD(P)H dehydrogenase (quinone)